MTIRLGIKRLVDVVGAGIAFLVLAPAMAIVALLIRVCMGRPILYRQVRPGHQAAPFALLKFRTMRNSVDANGVALPDGERLTRLGRFLRRSSLDELPQLWNVIRGEMSLVGPRPLLMEYIDSYSPEQMRRHDVKPGITGLAQISGRNTVAWEQKFDIDLWYVDNWSLWLDVRILAATTVQVIRGEGISGKGVATMSKFGHNPDPPR